MKSILAALVTLCSVATAAGQPPKLTVYPASIALDNARAEQRVIVLGEFANGTKADLTREAKYEIRNSKSATVDVNGMVRPLSDGAATLTITARGASANVPVAISKQSVDSPVNFATEIEPILTKAGCNSGNCHGAQHGRGGFRL